MVILHKLYGLFCAYIVKIFWREVETYEKKLKQIICTQMLLVMSILSIGCKNNPTVETGETVSNRETISTEIKILM